MATTRDLVADVAIMVEQLDALGQSGEADFASAAAELRKRALTGQALQGMTQIDAALAAGDQSAVEKAVVVFYVMLAGSLRSLMPHAAGASTARHFCGPDHEGGKR